MKYWPYVREQSWQFQLFYYPESINLRRNTDCNSSQSSLNYWSTGIKEVKYWLHTSQSNLNKFRIWNERSTPLYFVFNQIATWSKVSTPLIFTFATLCKIEMKPESPTDFHFYQVLYTKNEIRTPDCHFNKFMTLFEGVNEQFHSKEGNLAWKGRSKWNWQLTTFISTKILWNGICTPDYHFNKLWLSPKA